MSIPKIPKPFVAPLPLPQLTKSVTDERNRSRVLQAIATLQGDELQVLAIVAERLVTPGRSSYGQLRLEGDPRHFGDEALEEVTDGLTMAACALMRAARIRK